MNLELKKMPKTENMFRNCAMPSSHQKAWSFSLVREKSSEPPLMIVNPSGWPTFPPEKFFGPETWKISPESHFYFFRVFFCSSYVGVSENSGTPKSSILTGFSIIFTIQFGVPLFLETPISSEPIPPGTFFGRAQLFESMKCDDSCPTFLLSWGICFGRDFPLEGILNFLGGYQN